jgi:hypothetical protein
MNLKESIKKHKLIEKKFNCFYFELMFFVFRRIRPTGTPPAQRFIPHILTAQPSRPADSLTAKRFMLTCIASEVHTVTHESHTTRTALPFSKHASSWPGHLGRSAFVAQPTWHSSSCPRTALHPPSA